MLTQPIRVWRWHIMADAHGVASDGDGAGDPVTDEVKQQRREEISANLADVQARIRAAELAAARPSGSVELVVVTKTFPASDVAILAELGVTDVAENRDQEARTKHDELAHAPLRWHFIGQLQRNKCRSVATYAHMVESVDRAELIVALDRAAVEAGRLIEVLIQVDLEDPLPVHRGGASPADVATLADLVVSTSSLRLAGLMAVAPLGASPREAFDRLFAASVGLRRVHPAAAVISAGMSGDLEAAVAAGTTHVRVGSAVLGRRPTLR